MTQATPVEIQKHSLTTAEPDDDDGALPVLEEIGRDYERLSKRIATIIKNARNGSEVAVVDALSLQGELVMLLLDHLTHTKRMEEHAVWASETIEYLSNVVSGDSEDSSQLHRSNAAQYVSFFSEVLEYIEDRISALTPEGEEPPEGLVRLRDQAIKLRAFTEEITLEEEGDEPESDAAAESEASKPDASSE